MPVMDNRPAEQTEPPRVRAVVLAFRSVDTLPAAVDSLLAQRGPFHLDLVVVLNGATPPVRTVAAALPAGVTLVDSPENLGFAGGCNLGAGDPGLPAPDLLVFFNDDAVADLGWLAELVAFAGKRPTAGVVGSLLRFDDGSTQDVGGVLLADGFPLMVGRGLPAGDLRLAHARTTDYVTGAAMLVRAEAFDRVGGFDPAYFPAYFEDADLCLRLQADGWDCWVLPTAQVSHSESASTVGLRKQRMSDRNERRFLARWVGLLPGRVPRGRADLRRSLLAAQSRRGGHLRVLVAAGPGRSGIEPALALAAVGCQVDLLGTPAGPDLPTLSRAGVRVLTDPAAEVARPTGCTDLLLTLPGAVIPAGLRPTAVRRALTGTEAGWDPVDCVTLIDSTFLPPTPEANTMTPNLPGESGTTDPSDHTVRHLTEALGRREAELLITQDRLREVEAELAALRGRSSSEPGVGG